MAQTDAVANTGGDSLSFRSLAIQVGMSAGLQLTFIVLFSLLRPKNNVVYARRSKYSDETKAPPKLPDGIFSWVKPVLFADHMELAQKIGLDAVVFLHFLRFCLRVFIYLCGTVALVLIPINVASFWQGLDLRDTIGTDQTFDLSKLSINANVNHKDRIWAHAVMCWVASGIVYYLGYKTFKEFITMRQRLFASREYADKMYTRVIMVTQLPKASRSDDGFQQWLREFGVWHPNAVAAVNRKIGELPRLVEQHEKVLRQLESTLAKYYRDPFRPPSKRPTCRTKLFGGKRVDAIDYYSQQLDELETKIYATRQKFSNFKPSSVGFVCYPSVSAAHQAMRVLRSRLQSLENVTQLAVLPEVTLAPAPDDIIWSNVGLRLPERASRRLSGTAVFLGILLFGTFFVGWLSTLANVSKLMQSWLWTERIYNEFPKFFDFISASMPPIIMAVFFFLLPIVLRLISRYQGENTGYHVQRSVLKKFYLYLFVNQLSFMIANMLINILAAVFRGQWETMIHSTKATLQSLVQALVTSSNVWMSYITVRGIGLTMELLQLINLVRIFLRRRVLHPTPRELKEFTQPPDFPYDVFYGTHLFLMLISLMYSVISPLILFFACFTFFMALMVFRYQLMYVYTTRIETAGSLWPTVFDRAAFALAAFQGLMIFTFQLNQAMGPSFIVIPLPFITLVIWYFGRSVLMPQFKYCRMPTEPVSRVSRRQMTLAFIHPAFSGPLPRVMVSKEIEEATQRRWRSHEQSEYFYEKGGLKPQKSHFGALNASSNFSPSFYTDANSSSVTIAIPQDDSSTTNLIPHTFDANDSRTASRWRLVDVVSTNMSTQPTLSKEDTDDDATTRCNSELDRPVYNGSLSSSLSPSLSASRYPTEDIELRRI